MPQPLVTGRIVWSELADANGIRKLRPAVILTPTERITPGGPLDVVAITSRLSNPLPDDHVVLPWHPQGHPRTHLNCRCAAVCTWVARISDSDIHDLGGLVPAPLMLSILTKVAALPHPGSAPPADAGGGLSQRDSADPSVVPEP
jgi:mRNA-degrading endonuclease toxin of MazEF toxin-antitoxin module